MKRKMHRMKAAVLLLGLGAALGPMLAPARASAAGHDASGAASETTRTGQAEPVREPYVVEYNIGPRDLLEIKVFELPELNQTVRVAEDGTVSLPLVGSVKVGGMSRIAAERKIAELLQARYVKNARVSVFVKEYQSNLVAVIGAVEKPGQYELLGRQSLLELISRAGGFRENAADSLFVIRNNGQGEMMSVEIDIDELIIGGNALLNIPLQPHDVINVPADKIVPVYVFGEVKNPGAIPVRKSKGITLLQAITQAGGLTEDASRSGVTVKRRDKDGKETQIRVSLRAVIKGKKPDIELQEGDVVIVSASFF